MKVNIGDIKLKNRIREDLGDLSSLEQSINSFGLFNPVLINQNYELLAGARRLTACKNLGWDQIDAKIIHTNNELSKLEIESHENFMRKDFTEKEVEKIINKKQKLLQKKGLFSWIASFFKAIISLLKKLFKKRTNSNSPLNNIITFL